MTPNLDGVVETWALSVASLDGAYQVDEYLQNVFWEDWAEIIMQPRDGMHYRQVATNSIHLKALAPSKFVSILTGMQTFLAGLIPGKREGSQDGDVICSES